MCQLNNERYKLCMKLIAIFTQGLKEIVYRMIRIVIKFYMRKNQNFFVREIYILQNNYINRALLHTEIIIYLNLLFTQWLRSQQFSMRK